MKGSGCFLSVVTVASWLWYDSTKIPLLHLELDQLVADVVSDVFPNDNCWIAVTIFIHLS